MDSASRADVIVVGAGLSGLSVARLLHDKGFAVRVLEARDRVGGRLKSTVVADRVFDLGGQWLGPTQHRVRALASELGVSTFPQYHRGDKVLELDGARSTYRGALPSVSLLDLVRTELLIRRIDGMARRVPLHAPEQAATASEWDRASVASLRTASLGRVGKQLFDIGVRTVFGAEPAELSLLHFLFYLNAAGGFRRLVDVEGGAQQDRLVEGAQGLAEALAARLPPGAVRLGAPVRAIEQSSDALTVVVDDGERLTAQVAVVALPPHLAGRIRYEPTPPPAREQLVQRYPMGATIKVLAFYERAFWRAQGLSGEALSGSGPITFAIDNTSHDGEVPCLLGFVVGNHARDFARLSPEARRARALTALSTLFGRQANEPSSYFEQDWAAEPWTGGCPVASPPPGVLTTVGDACRAPFGRVHWAGTETAREWNGYMEGALEAAERAGAEVVAQLRGRSQPVVRSDVV